MGEEKKLEEVIYFLIDRTMRMSRIYSQQKISSLGYDVTIEQWVVIRSIYENPGINQRDLSRSIFKDPPTLTRMLDLLNKKGFVERVRNEEDRRAFSLYLTREGQKLIAQLTPIIMDIRKEGIKGLSTSEIEIAKRVLNQIYKNHNL